MGTFKEVGLALSVAANEDVDLGVEVVNELIIVGFEVFELDELHAGGNLIVNNLNSWSLESI